MDNDIFDHRTCQLGEGPLWHPLREQLFWFDILSNRLLTKKGKEEQQWDFDERVSAAGWLDADHLLIATETGLYRFNLEHSRSELVVEIEADNPLTRSNDGRADPWGGFWIGTMGKKAQTGFGSIYRYYRGEVRQLFADVTISNSICFCPDKRFAYFCDTPTQKIFCQPLSDKDGWPVGDPHLHIDLSQQGLFPDGSVVDTKGRLWNAQWGASRIACYSAAGTYLDAIAFPTPQISCPAFGGSHLTTLFATSAADGLMPRDTYCGQTFAIESSDLNELDTRGQPEHNVIL